MNFANFWQYNRICLQPIPKLNHVFKKISIEENSVFQQSVMGRKLKLFIFNTYLCNQLPKLFLSCALYFTLYDSIKHICFLFFFSCILPFFPSPNNYFNSTLTICFHHSFNLFYFKGIFNPFMGLGKITSHLGLIVLRIFMRRKKIFIPEKSLH